MTKKEFKLAYSDYRKQVSTALFQDQETYRNTLDSNRVFRAVKIRIDYPVSVKIYLYKVKKKSLNKID